MTTRAACPKCREDGHDKSGDNLVRYPDGGAMCFRCKYTEPKGGEVKKASKSKLSVGQVMSYPGGADPKRKLPQHIVDAYDLRVSVSVTTGDPDMVWYPYYQGSEMTGAKGRKLATKDFTVAGELTGVFGKQASDPTNKHLVITEGEEDALALATMLDGKPVNVVSLPNGANVDKSVKSDLDFYKQHSRVYLCFDADDPGKSAATTMGDWLCSEVDVYTVELERTLGKDAADYYVAGYDTEILEALRQAQKYEPEGVMNACEFSIEDLLVPLEEGYPLPYPGLQSKLHGIRKAEITTLCAGTGIGKSTLSREIAYSLLEQGCTVALVALEDQAMVGAQAIMAIDMNIPLHQMRMHPPAKSDLQPSYDKLIKSQKLYLWKHFGKMDSDNFFDKMNYYAKSKGVDFIVLDHLSSVVASSKESNERRAIDNMMQYMSELVVDTGVGLIQVVHLKRPTGDKSFSRGGEVSLDDLRGSASIEQYSWNVIGIERDQQGEDCDFSRVRVLQAGYCLSN